jgi:xylulokinase
MSTVRYLLAHDLGTTGNKATLFTDEGQLVRSIVYAYDTHYFNGNWAEQNPDDWWRAVCDSTQEILNGLDAGAVAAVSFSGQMMGCVCVDRQGRPLRPGIIWADLRSTAEAAQIRRRMEPETFYRVTGHRLSSSYSVTKLMWVKGNEPDVYRQTHKTLCAKDYVVLKLTGAFVTDYSDAAGTTAYDIHKQQWSPEITAAAGLDAGKFPDIRRGDRVCGTVTAAAAQACGLPAGTPVVLGGGDGACAAVGTGSNRPGTGYCYIGTSAWFMLVSDAPSLDPLMRTVNWVHIDPNCLMPNGTMQAAGGAMSWLKNEICRQETGDAKALGINPYVLIDTEATAAPVGANGLLFLPYLQGERCPHWDVNAKGCFVGIKSEHKREDVIRAVFEGVALNMNLILSILRSQMTVGEEIVLIGGGAKSTVWRQIFADVFNMRLKIPNLLEEATSLGAAILAGKGVGLFDDFDVHERFFNITSVVNPDLANHAKYARLMPVFEDCYGGLKQTFERLSRLNEEGL